MTEAQMLERIAQLEARCVVLVHERECLQKQVNRVCGEVNDMLAVGVQALARGRTQVVHERMDESIKQLAKLAAQ